MSRTLENVILFLRFTHAHTNIHLYILQVAYIWCSEDRGFQFEFHKDIIFLLYFITEDTMKVCPLQMETEQQVLTLT